MVEDRGNLGYEGDVRRYWQHETERTRECERRVLVEMYEHDAMLLDMYYMYMFAPS